MTEILIGMGGQVREQMKNTELDAIPLISNKSLQHTVQGRYCVSKGIRYRCTQGGIKLLTLYLPTFERRDRVIGTDEHIYIPPFMVHTFLEESVNTKSSVIVRVSMDSWNYSFEIDMRSEYNMVPDDFRLNQQRMRLAETFLRLKAFEDADQGLTHDNYSLMLSTVRRISRKWNLSDFEHALLLGMSFDWLQRLSGKEDCPASIAFGAYQRIYSSSKNGYHDVRSTEIGYDGGPIIYSTHRTHFANEKQTSLPRITIARNVLISERTFLEVGKGLSIKEFSWIAVGVNILKHEHRPEAGGQLSRTVDNTTFYPTEIGPYAFIGQNARILPKTFYIGKGAVVGLNSVVTRSVGDYAIVAGNPARLIKYNVELAERLEGNSKIDNCESESETSIPYEVLLQKGSKRKDVVIVGAQSPSTVVSTARLFKRVLCINCCVHEVVCLLKKLREHELYNVCLQSENMSLIHELNYRKPFALIWLSTDEDLLPFEPKIFEIIKVNSEAILVHKNGKLSAFLSSFHPLKSESLLKNDHYIFFSQV